MCLCIFGLKDINFSAQVLRQKGVYRVCVEGEGERKRKRDQVWKNVEFLGPVHKNANIVITFLLMLLKI